MLRHNDEIKQFTIYDEGGMTLQSAIDACEDGDVLYLSVGVFEGNVTVSKSITIIGRGGGGETTILNDIKATNNANITFSGIKFLSNIDCDRGANVTIKKCDVNKEIKLSGSSANIENCNIQKLYFYSNSKYYMLRTKQYI